MEHIVMPLSDLGPGQMQAVKVGGLDIVLVRRPDGQVHALRDRCPHFGAKLSNGRLQPMVTGDRHGERSFSDSVCVVRCPWHNYEFEVESGKCPADPINKRVLTYDVRIQDGMVVVAR